MKLDEQALRRANFQGGEPVTLADGQDWFLAKPKVRFVPDDGPTGFRSCLSLGDDYQELLAAAEEATEGVAVVGTELALGRRLLLTNYALDARQVAALLQFGYRDDDPEGGAIRDAVLDVAFGRGKGRPADGTAA